MPVAYSPAYTKRVMKWRNFIDEMEHRNGVAQFEDHGQEIDCWFYDRQDVFTTKIYQTLPAHIRDALSYTTEQAALDWQEFHTVYKARFNRPNEPKDTDNKAIVMITPASKGFNTWFTGACDDTSPTAPATGRGEGKPFYLGFTAEEMAGASALAPVVKEEEFEFIEPLEINDGEVSWSPAKEFCGLDLFSFGVRIPATIITANEKHTGNCNRVEIAPGLHMIVPAANNGAYDVDLSHACPVEDDHREGAHWNVDYNTGVVTPALVAGKGGFNLFTFEVKAWLIKNVPMNNPLGTFDIEAYSTEYFHPSWRLVWRVEKRSPGTGAGHVAGWMLAFRRFTT